MEFISTDEDAHLQESWIFLSILETSEMREWWIVRKTGVRDGDGCARFVIHTLAGPIMLV